MRLWSRLKNWLPPIAWACLIAILSADIFSDEHTSRFIIPALRWLIPHASAETLELMHAVIRKAAHVAEYFIFSVFLTHALRGKDRVWRLRWAIWAVVIAAGYAVLDEFHQSFVFSRTASPWDALLDTLGALTAQIFLWLWHVSRVRESSASKVSSTESNAEHAE